VVSEEGFPKFSGLNRSLETSHAFLVSSSIQSSFPRTSGDFRNNTTSEEEVLGVVVSKGVRRIETTIAARNYGLEHSRFNSHSCVIDDAVLLMML